MLGKNGRGKTLSPWPERERRHALLSRKRSPPPLNTSPGRKETGAKKSSLGYGVVKEAPGKTAKGVLPRPHGATTLSCGRPPRAFRRRLCKGRKLPHGIPAGVPPEKTRAGSFGRYPCREGVRTAGMRWRKGRKPRVFPACLKATQPKIPNSSANVTLPAKLPFPRSSAMKFLSGIPAGASMPKRTEGSKPKRG